MNKIEKYGRLLCKSFREVELEQNPDLKRGALLESYDECGTDVRSVYDEVARRFCAKLGKVEERVT